jgi:hypothetical protein
MKTMKFYAASLAAGVLFAGCVTPLPPGAEPGPDNTMEYDVAIDASPPGARIEANGADLGPTPLHLKIYGDPDGTFHDFGSYYYVIRALPITTNQYPQTRVFRTGHLLTPEDRIPSQVYFDMNQPPQQPSSYGYPPPAYYGPGPYYYPYPYYGYGPEFQFFVGPRFGPGFHHRRW